MSQLLAKPLYIWLLIDVLFDFLVRSNDDISLIITNTWRFSICIICTQFLAEIVHCLPAGMQKAEKLYLSLTASQLLVSDIKSFKPSLHYAFSLLCVGYEGHRK